jgi:hypothetical protein
MKKPKPPKSFTAFQLNRLPKEGYWLYHFTFNDKREYYAAYCIKNGAVKSIRHLADVFDKTEMLSKNEIDNPWYTLLWSCAPTKKGIERQEKEGDGKYYFFNSLDEMILAKETLPSFPDYFFIKAPNDF